MSIFQAIISGAVQGLTEFLPVSSSGHLAILHALFGIDQPQIAFDIFLHLGTALAVVIYFYKDILRLFSAKKKTLYFLIIASIPTAIIGFVLKDIVERFFGMPIVVASMLGVTAAFLIFASIRSGNIAGRKSEPLGIMNSLLVGIAQGLAVMPGLSRSGTTIATGILAGLDKEEAFSFSLLLSVPAVLGATALKMTKVGEHLLGAGSSAFIAGGLTSLLFGLAAIKILSAFVRRNRLYVFGIYCILLSGLIIILFR